MKRERETERKMEGESVEEGGNERSRQAGRDEVTPRRRRQENDTDTARNGTHHDKLAVVPGKAVALHRRRCVEYARTTPALAPDLGPVEIRLRKQVRLKIVRWGQVPVEVNVVEEDLGLWGHAVEIGFGGPEGGVGSQRADRVGAVPLLISLQRARERHIWHAPR